MNIGTITNQVLSLSTQNSVKKSDTAGETHVARPPEASHPEVSQCGWHGYSLGAPKTTSPWPISNGLLPDLCRRRPKSQAIRRYLANVELPDLSQAYGNAPWPPIFRTQGESPESPAHKHAMFGVLLPACAALLAMSLLAKVFPVSGKAKP